MTIITRRGLLGSLGVGASSLLLTGCDQITASPNVKRALGFGESLTMKAQRLVTDRNALAREFSALDMSPVFRTNGNTMPASQSYQAHAGQRFADWRLVIDGLVRKPQAFSLAQIRAMPARTQITRHDCVEGWSAVGKWTGLQLKVVLDEAGALPNARFVVFHCADDFDGDAYYESIDMIDAVHPQTILAWGMNDELLSVEHGAPIRVRVERQLGYKQAKYVMRIEVVETLERIGGGRGGYWEDAADYQWYAGI
jgi:DMSO/TMAO reductase YedYZ molybdopterin-dependent catalytic subunit